MFTGVVLFTFKLLYINLNVTNLQKSSLTTKTEAVSYEFGWSRDSL